MCNHCPPDPEHTTHVEAEHVRPCSCHLHLETHPQKQGIPSPPAIGVEHNHHVVQWLHPQWWLNQQLQPDPY